ncbi:hypothetical protein DMJ13_20135 [halophilic archaeon]|nr:hypothetical protein DMJ13_20135 [halophilic archaeon]
MLSNDSLWKKLPVIRTFILFLKEYSDTKSFAISSWVSSIFWIGSAGISWISTENRLYGTAVVLALLVYLIPAVIHAIDNWPFHVIADWQPLSSGHEAIRTKYQNKLKYKEPESRAKVDISLDKAIECYEIEFRADDPLMVHPLDEPGNAEYKEDGNKLVCDNIDNHEFYLRLRIKAEDGEIANVYRPKVYINDGINDKELLSIEVL